MDIDFVNFFSYKCLLCDTKVVFSVPHPTETSKVLELSDTVNKLICPKCGTSLSTGAAKAFDAVKKYNGTVYELKCYKDTVELN